MPTSVTRPRSKSMESTMTISAVATSVTPLMTHQRLSRRSKHGFRHRSPERHHCDVYPGRSRPHRTGRLYDQES